MHEEARGRVAVVTGGANGIGLGIVRHLAEIGMAVVAVDWSEDACRRTQEEFHANERVRIVRGDVGTPDGARAGIETAIATFGKLDLLVNNAALMRFETIADLALDEWREMFRVNVDGPMLCAQAALVHMQKQRSGAIVNVASVSGLVPYAGGGAYAATKAAVVMLSKVLALEAGPYGIRVNCICPGTIRHQPRADDHTLPEAIPIGRRGNPRDVAQLVAYLASDAATYLTGSVIALDGAETAGRKPPRSRKPLG